MRTIAVYALTIGFVALVAASITGCATVTTRTSTITPDENTRLVTRTMAVGTAKISEATPKASYEGDGQGGWKMTSDSVSSGVESDVTAIVTLVTKLIEAIQAAATQPVAPAAPLVEEVAP